jgi:beta-glucosidase-like glycosyl hydrolase/CubicO group peptidase (beta-lactamase class C family)
MIVRKIFLAAIFFLLFSKWATAQISLESALNLGKNKWVDSVYHKLNTEERIGQLFMVAAYSGGPKANQEAIEQLITKHQIGGLIFMQGGPVRQANLTNKFQSMAQVPLLLSMDAEWGLGMRLDSVMNLPRQMMIGATRDTSLMYQVAMAIAYQCKRMGVHIDFAPDVDINNNANNPVINSRSFGENKYLVTQMGRAYMKGLQDNGVMACLKHFPGHGNTATDSHKDLPIINRTLAELHEVELFPFKRLINDGAQSVMIAHLEVPALEKGIHIPTTLSYNTVTNLLKKELGFKGLVFTDALNMDGVAKYFQPGEVDLKAFLAGNDVLLFSQDVPAAIRKIKIAMEVGQIKETDLQERVKKILASKYDFNLNKWKPIQTDNLTKDLNQFTQSLRHDVAEAAATLVRDENNILAKLAIPNSKVQYIGVNTTTSSLETELIKSFPGLASSWLPAGSSIPSIDNACKSLNQFDVTIVAIHKANMYPAKNYGLDAGILSFLRQVQNHPKVIIVLMGNAYIMKNICETKSGLVLYEDDSISQRAAAEVLSGNIVPKGILPVSVCPTMNKNNFPTASSLPYELNRIDKPNQTSIVNKEPLNKLNAFMKNCVDQRVFPGARIIAMHNGKVIYNESFGHFDYQKKTTVDNNTLYDVASLTKVLSTNLAVMKLYEEGKLDLNKRLKDYLPWVAGSDKQNISIKNLLLHQAGLKAWIPFYKETIDTLTKDLRNDLYRIAPSEGWNTQVANEVYLRNDFKDTIWRRILDQPLEIIGKYVYSDLDFLFLQKVVEAITLIPLQVYVQKNFYSPMALKTIGYNPLKKFNIAQIAPTENDLIFRHQLIQGYVHDPGAAMLGGVAGHAGLFASAEDVAAIFLMLQKNGVYNGKRYFTNATVQKFIAYNSPASRRGLGFDKPSQERNDAGPCGERCSGYTFGHQGFTGTCAWADPANGVVFVFLSNRVCPSADNNAINKLSVRTLTQDYIYEALGIPVNRSRPEVYTTQLKEIK